MNVYVETYLNIKKFYPSFTQIQWIKFILSIGKQLTSIFPFPKGSHDFEGVVRRLWGPRSCRPPDGRGTTPWCRASSGPRPSAAGRSSARSRRPPDAPSDDLGPQIDQFGNSIFWAKAFLNVAESATLQNTFVQKNAIAKLVNLCRKWSTARAEAEEEEA